jgi:UDP-N-acetylmuramate--alanine ligase
MAVYLVGVKGVGMTALALILQQLGCAVRGADVVNETFVTDDLLGQHNIVVESFAEAHLTTVAQPRLAAVIYSGAHQGSHHALVQAATAMGVVVMSLAQAVGCLSRQKDTIAVAGVGGKSSTTAMLSLILRQAKMDPAFAIGAGGVTNLYTSGYWSASGRFFVVEADEYVADPVEDATPRFLYLHPRHAIVTSLVHDHPDFYPTINDTKNAFSALLQSLTADSVLVYNGDDGNLRTLVGQLPMVGRSWAVGQHANNEVVIGNIQVDEGSEFTLTSQLWGKQTLTIALPGYHHIADAAYAAVMAAALGVDWTIIAKALASYQSIARRFQRMGETAKGALCFDDYAHHPREIAAIIETLKTWYPNRRKVIAFQPHTFSRTKVLLTDFAQQLADPALAQVYLLPIFASAREQDDASVSSAVLAEAIPSPHVTTLSSLDELAQQVMTLDSHTVFITLGAGDIYKVYDRIRLH